MHRGYLLIRPRRHHGEQLREVPAHVRVRAVEDVHAGNLRGGLKHRLHDVTGRARHRGHDGVRVRFCVQRGVDVDDVHRVLHAVGGGEVLVVRVRLRRLRQRAPDVLRGHAVHLRVRVPGVVEDRSDVFRHEVDAEDADGVAAGFHHLNRGVRHDERIGDEHVFVLFRGGHQHALDLRVHVEVRDDADLFSLQLLHERRDRLGVGFEVIRLRLRERPSRFDAVRGDEQRRERHRVSPVPQQSRLFLHRLEHVAKPVGARPRQRGGAQTEVLHDVVVHAEDVLGGEPAEARREDAREPGRDLRVAVSAEEDFAVRVERDVDPRLRRAAHDAVRRRAVRLRERGEVAAAGDERLELLGDVLLRGDGAGDGS
mmetsp:Transcript_14125/g.50742  ORF Transcript_14125/g.50742 Transcript_14125/m.50742 type:complete len:369 (+) Transcript_14125:1774-2880(+)